ncbi:MAG: DUF480 domain-containing protein [Gammaproteobacteria bacterium]|nr:DUF480 domain-containing protein [Gammaproteobacteria bacterium]
METLSFEEARVIGVLIEKEKTTPDVYPMSLNGLTTACNQKSNREPVVNFSETQVQQILDGLIARRLVLEESGRGSRVIKYKHRFANSEFGELRLSDQELGILTVMFLRGPQTPGELRSRTNRLCTFSDVSQVEQVLNQLIRRDDGPFVMRMEREPGRRESRYAHLFSGDKIAPSKNTYASVDHEMNLEERVFALEQRLAELEDRLAALEQE